MHTMVLVSNYGTFAFIFSIHSLEWKRSVPFLFGAKPSPDHKKDIDIWLYNLTHSKMVCQDGRFVVQGL